MKRKILFLSLILSILMIVPSLATIGHIDGCTNTDFTEDCCTKTFNITPKDGYRIIDVKINGVSQGPITSYTFTDLIEAQTMKVITEPLPTITVIQQSNGTITPNTTTVNYGGSQEFTITPNEGYVIATLVVNGANQTVSYSTGMSYTFSNVTSNQTITATFKKAWAGWNEPVLIDGLTPVNWNSKTYSWDLVDDIADWDYNYNSVATATQTTVEGNGNGKWANAMTEDGSMYVWIPRYTYQITEENGYNHAPTINSWNSEVGNNKVGKVEIKFSNGVDDTVTNGATTSNKGFIKHPAFTFGDEELTGIWVAKYEASQGDTPDEVVLEPTTLTNVAKFVPGVSSWRDISVSNAFDYAYNTFRNADSHLMKNVEWGAVAYLANAIGRIPYKNNNSDYITGIAGNSQNGSTTQNTTNNWKTTGGVKASTTHNVYGIYDMSGGALEYVAAYYTEGSMGLLSEDVINRAAGKLYKVANYISTAKYVDIYAGYTRINTGDAIYETSAEGNNYSITAWDGGGADNPLNPALRRGYNGIFGYSYVAGIKDTKNGFRAVLAIPSETTKASIYTISASAADGGTISPSGQITVASDSNQTFTITTKDGFIITDVIVDGISVKNLLANNEDGSVSYTFNRVTNHHTITARFEYRVFTPNEPVLIDGLTPVNWNGLAWTKVDNVNNWDYNYNSVARATQTTVEGNGNGKWANAMTGDGSLYVWIPRYSYRITEETGYNQAVKSWNCLDELNQGIGKVEITFSNGTNDTVTSETGLSKDGYVAHPAFTFGDKELTGIWVAKYEASRNDATSSYGGTGTTVTFKPDALSWVTSHGNASTYAYNTFRSADSHLMENSEWGAVAYLTNAIGRIPYVNNADPYVATEYSDGSHITGRAGSGQDAGYSSLGACWNTVAGVKASTTHNVYGIYDMSGGAGEYVNASSTSDELGCATYETENWDSDLYCAYKTVYIRGGTGGTGGSSNGIFAFENGYGDLYGFRAVLAIPH